MARLPNHTVTENEPSAEPQPAEASDTLDTAPADAAPPSGSGSRKRRRGGKGKSGGSGGGGGGRAVQYWMVVTSPDNFTRTREHGFSIQGIKSRHKNRVASMHAGDRLLYYVHGRMAFSATATITSPMYEDHTPIWRTDRRDEDYPWRVHIRLDQLLEEPDWVLAKDIAYRLEYVKKWPPEHWPLAFQGHLHQLPKTDFTLLEDEIIRLVRRLRAKDPVAG
jgi:predicted RNA-binding protein